MNRSLVAGIQEYVSPDDPEHSARLQDYKRDGQFDNQPAGAGDNTNIVPCGESGNRMEKPSAIEDEPNSFIEFFISQTGACH